MQLKPGLLETRVAPLNFAFLDLFSSISHFYVLFRLSRAVSSTLDSKNTAMPVKILENEFAPLKVIDLQLHQYALFL